MKLDGLLQLVQGKPLLRDLPVSIRNSPETKYLALRQVRAFLLAALYRELKMPILVIAPRGQRARQLQDEIAVWLGGEPSPLLFPEPDILPYEALSSDLNAQHERLRVLALLAQGGCAPLIVASVYAIARKTVPAARFASANQTFKVGDRIDLESMLAVCMQVGYEMASTVDIPGTMGRRGGIIDIYSPQNELPARIELFGNMIESIRLFHPQTQRSMKPVEEVSIIPAREMIVEDGELQSSIERMGFAVETRMTLLGQAEGIARGGWSDRLDLFSSLVNQGSFLDYLPPDTLVVVDEPEAVVAALNDLDAQAKEIRASQEERDEFPRSFPVPYFRWVQLSAGLERFNRRLSLEEFPEDELDCTAHFSELPAYNGNLEMFLQDVQRLRRETDRRIVIVSHQAARLSELLMDYDILAEPVKEIAEGPSSGSLTLVQGGLPDGWMFNGRDGLALYTDSELFGFVKKERTPPRRAVQHRDLLYEVSEGDFVVHVDHGIARFGGMATLDLEGATREYLVLEYAAGDRLYVPADQVDRVARYVGPGGYTPSLTRLGTQEWSRAKQRVREAAGKLAGELLALYSMRDVSEGFNFAPDTVWQQELEASFPYIETPDQLRVVLEVKQDMEKRRPMDRLVCGDVGYGKTEVALRAAFKAVMNGMQVAILVPTTVLAGQHLATFAERMKPFPIRVELLSRFRSAKEQAQVIAGLENGSVDICVGTHRLLQKDVSFKNLGLVIIDEEQRFGVVHKERLKRLRQEVDVLTLSATPIPRTLHMSLVGVRDMSCMETPPEERLPVKTFVGAFNERIVREAILRELDRNGQVFYVHNRVQTILMAASRVQSIVPEARVSIGHGQMPEETLEKVMLDFAEGDIDVLVCTTIIESGLDFPSANTLILEDSDRLGLTQLYQLRGRVGRGANRAFAYFFYDKGKQLTDTARRRLKTIFEATELGAGFQIAMKDLEIRGAGNILGAEQSGHMGAVGYELYSRLLSEAVSDVKAGTSKKLSEKPSTSVNIPLPAHLPEEYISDVDARLSMYLKISRAGSPADLSVIENELIDRFGPLPPEVVNLLYVVDLKLLTISAGIQEIVSESGQIVIKMGPETEPDRAWLQRHFAGCLKIGPTQLRLNMRNAGRGWRRTLREILEALAGYADNITVPASTP